MTDAELVHTKELAFWMVERVFMNPISAKLLNEDWRKAFPDEVAVAERMKALVEAVEKAQGMETYWKTQCRGITDHCEELQARIAELESHTVKPPVHPTVASEKLDDETLQELIEFRRTTFEYHSKEGNKVQTIIHGVTLAALRELQERRKADSEPVAWTDEEELRDVNVAGIGYLFGIDREANKFADPRRQIMLYRHAQPAPVVTFYRDGIEAAAKWIDQQREAYDSEHGWSDPGTGSFEFGNDAQREYSSTLEELAEGIRALHQNAGNSPVIPDGWTGNDKANAALIMLDRIETVDPVDDDRIEGIKRIVRELVAAPTGIPVIPDGYVMVPKEPTCEMIWAAKYCFTSTPGWDVFKSAYIAMLAAAPQEVKP